MGLRRVGLEGWAQKGGAPKGGGAKISRFFFPFPPPFRCFCVSLGVFSWNFGGVLKRGALKCARLEFSGCHVGAPEARSGGAQRDTERAKRWREREERAKFWAVAEGVQGSPNQQPQQPRTTTTPNPEQVGPRRAGPLSQARFRVCVFRGWANNTQQHHKTTTTTTTTTTENFVNTLKHCSSWPKSVWPKSAMTESSGSVGFRQFSQCSATVGFRLSSPRPATLGTCTTGSSTTLSMTCNCGVSPVLLNSLVNEDLSLRQNLAVKIDGSGHARFKSGRVLCNINFKILALLGGFQHFFITAVIKSFTVTNGSPSAPAPNFMITEMGETSRSSVVGCSCSASHLTDITISNSLRSVDVCKATLELSWNSECVCPSAPLVSACWHDLRYLQGTSRICSTP